MMPAALPREIKKSNVNRQPWHFTEKLQRGSDEKFRCYFSATVTPYRAGKGPTGSVLIPVLEGG
jgi:hypothetical protein